MVDPSLNWRLQELYIIYLICSIKYIRKNMKPLRMEKALKGIVSKFNWEC